MAKIEEIRVLMKEQQADLVTTMREELATWRTSLAEELRTELRQFVRTEIQKSEERSAPKPKVAKGSKSEEG